MVNWTRPAGISVDEILQSSTIGRVVVPDGEFEQGGTQQEKEFGFVALLDGWLRGHMSVRFPRGPGERQRMMHTLKYLRPPQSCPFSRSSSSSSSSSVSSWPTLKAGLVLLATLG